MQEIELKFLVPESRLKGLMRQAQVKSSQTIQLAAHYYDTSDQKLAQAGIGLRIRQEGDTWVQTIKAGGDGIAARLEHNTILDNEQVKAMLDNDTLMPDLTIYKDTSIAPALADFKLKKLAKKLTRLYLTDVERTTRLLIEDNSDEDSSKIEIAYDRGEVIHGNDDTQRNSIQEIEFELVAGDVDFLFTTAKTWCKRYKLCLSTVTKAERGGLLIKGQSYSPAVSADLSQLTIDKNSDGPAFIRTAVHNCLLHILPNSSAIVAGSDDNEHILQLTIGLTRLQAALQAFDSFSDEINPDWLPILKQTATLLADYQKLAYLTTHIEPKLQSHGAPSVDWTADIETLKIQPIDVVSANDFQLTLLELIAFTMSNPSLEPRADKPAVDKSAKILSKQYTKFIETERRLQDKNAANDNEPYSESSKSVNLKSRNHNQIQDDLYCQLVELRYTSEFASLLLSKKKAKKKAKIWLKRLVKAQQALAQYRTHTQYQQYYERRSATDINALYGTGWFAATLKKDLKHARKRLAKVQDSPTFW
ncbi:MULTISPECIES: CYTH and CHAD domain-containing protein [unclassified Psychrobacter]|uniref:CYTH and CHAD domain-containing protein n=1 Tax=unclassified Psychrobacter TaxID=196806 RepID=UPI00071E6FAA|nr:MULTISPECIES: CYTH and CHAD domain-containing protein [unclassified Psychrobacter]OLF39213.1 inorganic triphosphatase [Psychrobacter sp. Cmf 22.2]